MRPSAAVGPDKLQIEYLSVLANDFSDPKSPLAMGLVNDVESAYVNGELPRWFYADRASARLVALVKTSPSSPDSAPTVRPIGMRSTRCRSAESSYAKTIKSAVTVLPAKAVLESPAEILVLQAHPGWLLVKLVEENAFSRSAASRPEAWLPRLGN